MKVDIYVTGDVVFHEPELSSERFLRIFREGWYKPTGNANPGFKVTKILCHSDSPEGESKVIFFE